MTVATKLLLSAVVAAAGAPLVTAQQRLDCGYPERDVLSPFRNPTDITAPPDELFRNLRIMRNIAAQEPQRASLDKKGRQVVDNDAWRQAYARVQELGLDAGMLAQMMRLHRNADQRAVAFFAGFYCDNIGYVMELISHIPGEPVRAIREQALPMAVAFLRAHLGRTFGDLSEEERGVVLASSGGATISLESITCTNAKYPSASATLTTPVTMAVSCPFASSGSPVSGFSPYSPSDDFSGSANVRARRARARAAPRTARATRGARNTARDSAAGIARRVAKCRTTARARATTRRITRRGARF